MKTIHTRDLSQLPGSVYQAAREVGLPYNFRVIQCGAGLVLLPETDRSKDATEGEVIKALGFRNKAESMPIENESKRTNYAVNREGEFWGVIGLTQAQERLLRYIERNELLWDEVRFDPVKTEIENI